MGILNTVELLDWIFRFKKIHFQEKQLNTILNFSPSSVETILLNHVSEQHSHSNVDLILEGLYSPGKLKEVTKVVSLCKNGWSTGHPESS